MRTLLTLLLSTLASAATTYYIAPGGNDSHTGLDAGANAWAHVFQSIPKLHDGDRLFAVQSSYTDGVSGSSSSCTANNVVIDLSNSVVLVTSTSTGNGAQDGNWKLVGNNILLTNLMLSTSITGQSGARSFGFHGGFVEFDGANEVVANCVLTNVSGALQSGDVVWCFVFQVGSQFCTLQQVICSNLYDCDFCRIWGISNTIDTVDYGFCYNSNYPAVGQGGYGIHSDFIQNFSFDSTKPAKYITVKNCYLHDCTSWSPQMGNTECAGNLNMHDFKWENCVFSHYYGTFFSGIPATKFWNCTLDDVGNDGVHNVAVTFYQSDDSANGVRWSTNSEFLNCVGFNTSIFNTQNLAPVNNPISSANILQAGNYTGATPGFVSEAGQNYHLTSGSTLRNRGTNLFAVFTTDKDGLNRPAPPTPFDTGAYQFASAPPPTTTVTGTQLRGPLTINGTIR
jgi:hypothetical protein